MRQKTTPEVENGMHLGRAKEHEKGSRTPIWK
jgi:hypothetical protein